MARHFQFVVCLIATLVTGVAHAQVASPSPEETGPVAVKTSPVAYVYVASSPSSGALEINEYTTSSDGRLTAVTDPLSTNVSFLTANHNYVFGTNGIDIDSFSIASNGSLQQVSTIDAQGFNTGDCGGPGVLFVDRTGQSLYDNDIYSDCANNAFQSFGVDRADGQLDYLGVTAAASPEFAGPLSFLGNDKYGYGASCYHWYQSIYGFERNSDGSLTDLNIAPAMPTAKTGTFYCPGLAAADSSNHVAVAMGADDGSTLQPTGLAQLATYTADSTGSLTTTSTYANMPRVAVGVSALAMSPSGKLLAVAGPNGVEVFHFNGSNPITHYTGLLTKDPIEQVGQILWDNDDHLYVISQTTGKLFVFTITPYRYTQAPGSPYSIVSPETIAVVNR